MTARYLMHWKTPRLRSAGSESIDLTSTATICPEGYEVDFLARWPDGRTELIQVCADIGNPATAARECRALVAAGKLHPQARKRLLTCTHDGLPPEAPAGTEVQTAAEWLLADNRLLGSAPGSLLRYDEPFAPATDPSDWTALH